MKKFLIIAIVAIFAVNVFAEDPVEFLNRIKTIQGLFRDSDTWQAELTEVSMMKDKEKLCGLIEVPTFKTQREDENYIARGNANLKWKMSAIKNQGNCGSCWAFAMVACVEAVHNGGSLDLSEQHLVSCCKSSSGCDGGYISSTASWVQSNGGVCKESDFPYTATNGTCKSVNPHKSINGYYSIYSDSALKSALDKGHVVNTGMKVYRDFYNYKSGIYKHVTGDYLGGHAVVVCGYDDAQGYWLVRNSWGTGWGENGYFRIAYGQCSIPWMAIAVK